MVPCQNIFKRFQIRQLLQRFNLLGGIHVECLYEMFCLAVDNDQIVTRYQVILADHKTDRTGCMTWRVKNLDLQSVDGKGIVAAE